MRTKICTKCGLEKPTSEFNKNKQDIAKEKKRNKNIDNPTANFNILLRIFF